jgi:nucleotide-binding universal stress UspA family protein
MIPIANTFTQEEQPGQKEKGGTAMLPCKQILVPTDFSSPSYEAVKAAGELALHFSSTLSILHVIPPVPIPHGTIPGVQSSGLQPDIGSGFDVASYEKQLESAAMESLEEVIKQRVRSPVLAAHPAVRRGDPPDVIASFAAENGMDLIVIATHGRTGWRRLAFGSVAEKVIRLAPCPVLTIREPGEQA